MPGEKEDTEEQNSFFGGAFTFLMYLIVFSTVLGFLTCVFNFYNFNYTQYYSVIFFYLFLMTCTFILPDRMIGVEPPAKTITSSIKDFSTGASNFAGVTLGWKTKTTDESESTKKSWFSFGKKTTTDETVTDGSEPTKKSWFSSSNKSTTDGSEPTKKSWFSSSNKSTTDGTEGEKKSWLSFGKGSKSKQDSHDKVITHVERDTD
jgi:hypothetical protein